MKDKRIATISDHQTVDGANRTMKEKPITRNYLKLGDKVRMKDSRILTIKSLEYREFVSKEESGYIPKNDIDIILTEQ